MSETHLFRGRTMREAVVRLKAALGPDAVIVGTRRVQDREGGFVEIHAVGPAAAPAPEVTPPALGGRPAAVEAYRRTASPPASSGPAAPPSRGERRPVEPPRPDRPPAAGPPTLSDRTLTPAPLADVAPLPAPVPLLASAPPWREDLASLREVVERLAQRVDRPAAGLDEEALRRALGPIAMQLRELRAVVENEATVDPPDQAQARALTDALVRAGLTTGHARDVAWRVQRERPGGTTEDADTLARVGRWLAQDLVCTGDLLAEIGPAQRRVLAFVGPTGVGKTTTIGKVAAHAALLRGISTALVTVDTYRLAAVEQLARYAEILECPLRVVKSPEALPGALRELSASRLVLVDTTGRNPRMEDQVDALARFFPPGWGGRLVLTVAANVRERDLFATTDAFEKLGCDALCATKLDETDAPGGLYSLVRRTGRPLSWITAGQRVPEDLEVAAPDRVAARIAARAGGEAPRAVG